MRKSKKNLPVFAFNDWQYANTTSWVFIRHCCFWEHWLAQRIIKFPLNFFTPPNAMIRQSFPCQIISLVSAWKV